MKEGISTRSVRDLVGDAPLGDLGTWLWHISNNLANLEDRVGIHQARLNTVGRPQRDEPQTASEVVAEKLAADAERSFPEKPCVLVDEKDFDTLVRKCANLESRIETQREALARARQERNTAQQKLVTRELTTRTVREVCPCCDRWVDVKVSDDLVRLEDPTRDQE